MDQTKQCSTQNLSPSMKNIDSWCLDIENYTCFMGEIAEICWIVGLKSKLAPIIVSLLDPTGHHPSPTCEFEIAYKLLSITWKN